MEFFNKKEEVMEIQLTSYGKELLSRGKFKPIYYAFFDEGILYDGAWGGITENQNIPQERIKNYTPFMKDTKEYLGADAISKNNSLVPENPDVRRISLFDFDSSYENQLGVSKNNSNFTPAWNVKTLQSRILNSSAFLTASAASRSLPIPQINIDGDSIKYITSVIGPDGGPVFCSQGETPSPEIEDDFVAQFADGTKLIIKEGSILLKVQESNTLNHRDNFEVELFEVVENDLQSQKTKFLRPLKFFKFLPAVQNNLLINPNMSDLDLDNLDKIDKNFASNYFEILIDESVDQGLIRKYDPNRKTDTLFVKDPIDMAAVTPAEKDIYEDMDDSSLEEFVNAAEEEGCE